MTSKRKAGPRGNPRWSASEAEEILASLEKSGQSVAAFARERGVTPQRLYWWRDRLRRRATRSRSDETSVELVPVRITHDARREDDALIIVRLRRGVALEVPPAASPLWVAELARALDPV
jgi:transposase-like protein